MKKIAYTLAEVTIVITVIGLLSVVLVNTVKIDRFRDKQEKASVIKVIDEFNVAAAAIRDLEKKACPFKIFAYDVAGDMEYSLYKKNGSALAGTEDALAIFEDYLKLDRPSSGYYDFCDYTGWTSCPDDIKAARLIGEVYVGLKVTASTSTGALELCQDYYRISTDTKTEGGNELVEASDTDKKCWADLYIDINGKKGPNEVGKDIFIYSMGAAGIIY